ncbi:uncharacterized protein TM35_000031750 [Trypanosoma theileri]|uniref:Mucin-associated surface protein (MASP) n=1 Tax=Trypanosoma theileri TaxID=67003 RepID=A0A1X0P664_9TRYP|nr:uncharacterized protein TM35_000031750 [Trypanosoma theileri]ORC92422.1 hypothetical protein TM35_000031750 [Trypanosoma theileri]
MAKTVMVRCYLLCLLTLALCCACGLVWADSPKASDALIKPSSIGVPSLVRRAVTAFIICAGDEKEGDVDCQCVKEEHNGGDTEHGSAHGDGAAGSNSSLDNTSVSPGGPDSGSDPKQVGGEIQRELESENAGKLISSKGEHDQVSAPPPAISDNLAQGAGGVNGLDSQVNKGDNGEKQSDNERRELSQTSIINPLQGENAKEEPDKKPEVTPVAQSPSDPNGNSEVLQTPSPQAQEISSVNTQGSQEKEHNAQSNNANTDNSTPPSKDESTTTATTTTTTTTTTTLPPELTNNKKGDADSSSSSISSSVWVRVPLLIVVTLACILVC